MASITWYIQFAEHMYHTSQGIVLAQLLSLSDDHVLNGNLFGNDIALRMAERCVSPLDDIIISHLLCVKALHMHYYVDAFNYQRVCMTSVVQMLQAQRGSNWMLPVMFTVCLDLRMVAQKADFITRSRGAILEKAAESLMACLRVCVGDNSTAQEHSKKQGILGPVNHLLRIYFRIDKYKLCQLIRAIEPTVNSGVYSMSQRVTFKFFVGRLAVIEADFVAADRHLTFAFQKCHATSYKNKRLILTYLMPVKMLLGYMPAKQLAEKYNLLVFWNLVAAVRDGNLKVFGQIVSKNRRFFENAGLFMALENLRMIAYRNVFKKVYLSMQNNRIPISYFQAGLQVMAQQQVKEGEAQTLLASMIFDNKIKAYMSYQNQVVVFSPTNAFPRLSTLNYITR